MMSRIPEARMKSIRPYKTSEQYLYAMKEDLAEWLQDLYGVDIGVGSFLEVLETGVWLCQHANCIAQVARDFAQKYPYLSSRIQMPNRRVVCNDSAQAGTFQARDNVSNFIQWCRKEMGIKEVLMFETEDLVLRKNEKNFVLCLLEVARRASRFGMKAPTLVRMEEEIEEEIRRDLNLPPDETPLPKPKREPTHFRNLDQMVQHLVSRCTCPVQFSMVKVSEGKYRVGESSTLIFVRILRKHVMVRVGGGWDTLEHYLDKHDPCRCTSLSHKQAMRMASPQRTQATPVQHEIMARLTPRTDNPHKPQPALIVSRSQSPLAPVEWRTYVPHALGAGRKASAMPSSDSVGTDGRKKVAAMSISQDQSEHRRAPSSLRMRERSATPSGKWTTTEERPSSEQTIFTRGRSQTFHGSISCQPKGNTRKDLSIPKCLPGPENRPRAGSLPMATVAPREKGKGPVPSGAAGQRAGTPQPPGKSRPEGNGCLLTRPSSPAKPLRPSSYQQTTIAPSGQERVIPGYAAQRSASPVKNTSLVHKMDIEAPGKVGWPSCRPPTPSKSQPRWGPCFRNGGDAMAGDQGPKGEEPGKIGPGEACRWRFPGPSGVGTDRMDSGWERKSGQPCLRAREIPHGPRKDTQKSCGDTKARTMEKERVYTPLPLNLAEERALYQTLEEEIMANVKELEADFDDKDLPSEVRSEGFRMSSDRGKDGPVLGPNGPKLSVPTSAFPEKDKGVLGYGEGVPRSGVYVPERETRWRPKGVSYEDVIRELSMALQREEMEAARCSPPLGSSLVNGAHVEKKDLESKVPQEEKSITPETKDIEPSTHKVCEEVNGDTNSSESLASPEEAKLPPNKPKRSLKKPERVPSIYKLKLRPKVRPRRDNRPEKRPSRIPRPVSYCCAPKASGVKGRGKARSPKGQGQAILAKVRPNSSGNIGAREEAVLSKQDGEGTPVQKEMGVPGGKETWV